MLNRRVEQLSVGVRHDNSVANGATAHKNYLFTKGMVAAGTFFWRVRQDLNLKGAAKIKGNSKSDAQRDAQKLVPLGHDLTQVVIAWSKLPASLKAAILAIVKSVGEAR